MAEEPDKKDDKFEFTPEGESVEYISLGDARMMAIRHARDNTEIYGAEYQDTSLVWEPVSEEESEEFYDIKLSFRPAGTVKSVSVAHALSIYFFDEAGSGKLTIKS